ncbi:hypothetical protein ACSS6W_010128 [Trichoderma asperelloides]
MTRNSVSILYLIGLLRPTLQQEQSLQAPEQLQVEQALLQVVLICIQGEIVRS